MLCSPWRRRATAPPCEKTASAGLVGTVILCPPLAMPLHFLSGEHRLAESQCDVWCQPMGGRTAVLEDGSLAKEAWAPTPHLWAALTTFLLRQD